MSCHFLPALLCSTLSLSAAIAAEPQANPAPARTAQVQTAAGQAAQATVVRGFPGGGTPERENVDPQDPVERFALLTPGGPLVIEATLTIDGQPFRTVREKLIDELLVAADKDKDGKPTWDEALTASRFTLGRLPQLNEQQKKSYLANLDKNSDNVVDRGEVRLFLAQFFQGATFSLGAGFGAGGPGGVVVVNGRMAYGGGQADVRALLDLDSDGVLSDKEIAAATDRLKSRDADDNDLLYATEIGGEAAALSGGFSTRQMVAQQPANSLLLGPTAKADALHAALLARYKNADGKIAAASFSVVPKLFAALDKDSNGTLEPEETLGLNDVPPHVSLTADVGSSGKAKGLALKSVSPELSKTGEAAESIGLEMPGLKVSLTANLAKGPQYNFEQTATSTVARFDKDSNQYLEKTELPDGIVQQFDGWDTDGDGKVYAAEIAASYARTLAPQASQVTANVSSQGNSLFQALDQTGDGRLSLREMRAASERIKALDADKDGRITQAEIPATMTVAVGLGTSAYSAYGLTTKLGGATPVAPAPAAGVPEWFARMDRNGDGDVTLKEFLGDEADFKKLDTNSDGFIEVKEAKEAK